MKPAGAAVTHRPSMSEHGKGTLFLLGAAVSWSLGGLLIKLVALDPLAIAGWRSGIAALVLLAAFRWIGARVGLRPTPRIAVGAVAYAGTVITFVVANKATTAANAILLQYTAPIWVALLAPLVLREPIRRSDWIAIVLVLGGMALFFVERLSATDLFGNMMAIGSGAFFGGCILALRSGRGGGSIRMVLWGNALTALLMAPWMFASPPASGDVPALLALGTVQLGLGYVLFVQGIARVPAIEAVLIPVLEPLLNPLWVALAVGELPSAWSVAGGVVVLGAVTGRGLVAARRRTVGG